MSNINKSQNTIIKYYNTDGEKYHRDLQFWCNACGELHNHSEYDINEDELPEPLRIAYQNLWTDGSGSLCYLVDYRDEYYVALINEYDDVTAENIACNMKELYKRVVKRAECFRTQKLFDNTIILTTEHLGFCDCHELIVLVEPTMAETEFKAITDQLYHSAYDL